MKFISLSFYIFFIFFSSSVFGDEASDWLKKEIDIILNAYKNENLPNENRFLMVEQTINNNFAGAGIAKFVSGKAWNNANKEIKKDYIKNFKRHLALNIASIMKGYSGQSYSFVNIIEDDQNKVIIVDMEIKDETSSMSMIVRWRIKQSKEKYYVIDLLIADISLIITKRSEFNSALKKNDYDLKIFNNILKEQNEISYSKIVQ